MNSSGLVVGQATAYSQGTNLGERAIIWDGLSPNSLGTFGTTSFGSGYSSALAINQGGTAVGTATMYSNGNFVGQRVFQWSSGTGLIDLGVLQNDPNLVNASTRAVVFEKGSKTQIAALGLDAAGFAKCFGDDG